MIRVERVTGNGVCTNHGEIPKNKKLRRKWVGTVLSEMLRRYATEVNVSYAACVLTSDGKVYFGVPIGSAHPNYYGTPIEVAAGLATTSGSPDFLGVGIFDTHWDQQFPRLRGVEVDTLTEHFPEGIRDMYVVDVRPDAAKTHHLSDLTKTLYGGRHRVYREHRMFQAVREAPAKFEPWVREHLLSRSFSPGQTVNVPKTLVNDVQSFIRPLFVNTTGDGRVRPGRKRHVACLVIYGSDGKCYLSFGVNLRADCEGADRCSEVVALGNAYVSGFQLGDGVVMAFIYSPDYAPGRNVCMCHRCQNSLSDAKHDDFRDIVVVYGNDAGPNSSVLFSALERGTSYAAAE